jgi:hypothetical protein
MKRTLFYCLCVLLPGAGVAQSGAVQVGRQADISKFFSESRWLLPVFTGASVFLKQSRTKAKMNYDLLTEKMVFITPQGDTLALANQEDVLVVQFDKRYFKPHHQFFIEVIARAGDSELWIRRQIKKTDTQKTGAYGLPSATSAVTNINTVHTGSYYKDIEVAEWSKYTPTVSFYLFAGGKARAANKSAFLKTYSGKKKEIESYLKKQAVDFEYDEDLIRLFNFCAEPEN